MSYIGLTLPRKPKRRGRITQLQESSIYSTLSKKPADLETTDIDLSAVRIFLGDGSHRTIRCTPATTCGEILARLLRKLGLSERAEEYALQIKYTYAEPRVADESEKLSEVNRHVWDSVDRIHLFWKTDSPPPIPRRKRLKSFEGTLSKEEGERIQEKFAILSQHVEPDTEPVIVNETLAKSFATAWNTGCELQKAGECGEHKPLQSIPFQPIYENTKARQLSPQTERKYSYTLDRQPKDPTIRRRLPVGVSPRQSPRQSPTSSPIPMRKRITKAGSPQDTTDYVTIETSQVSMHTTPVGTGATTQARSVSPELPDLQSMASPLFSRGGDGRRCLRRPSASNSIRVATKEVDKFRFSRNKSLSEACLLTAIKTEGTAENSPDTLRDSGFDEPYRSCHLSINDLRSRNQPPSPRKKTVSLENFPIPSLAKHTIKAPLTKTRSLEGTSGQRVRTKVRFFQEVPGRELPDQNLIESDAVNTVTPNSSTGPHSIVPSTPPNHPSPPIVPQRVSAYLQNCTVPDDYLLKQGKRLSQMLNLTPKKEEKHTFRSFHAAFSKVGTLLKKGRSPSLAENTPQFSPSPTKTKKPLGFPDTPTWKADRSPKSTTPQHEEVNSMGVRWSCVEYDPVSIGHNKRPVLAKNTSKLSLAKSSSLNDTATQQPTEHPPICKLLSDPQCPLPASTATKFHITKVKQHHSSTLKASHSTNDLLSATPEPDMEGRFSTPHSNTEDEQYDIAVLAPIPSKEPEYLEIVADIPTGAKQPAPKPPHSYDFDPSENHVYETLPSCHHKSKLSAGDHPRPIAKYENQEIHPTPLDGIAFAGADLHVYHVPGPPIVPPPPLPPRSSCLTQSLPPSCPSPPPLYAPGPPMVPPPSLPPLSSCTTHSLPPSPPNSTRLPPNQNQQLLPAEPCSSEPDQKKTISVGQLQPEKVNNGFTQQQPPPEVPGYSKLHSYNVHDTNTTTDVILTNPTKAADGMTYRSWSTPVENPRDELQRKLKKRAALLQAATTETPSLSPQNAPSPPDSKTKPLPPPPLKPKPTPELPPPLSKISSAILPPPPHERPIFVPPPPPPFPPDTSPPPPPPPSDTSQAPLPPPPPPPVDSKPSLTNSKATTGSKFNPTTRPVELFSKELTATIRVRFDQTTNNDGQR